MLDGGGEHVAQLFQAQRLLRGEENRFQNQFQFHAILRQRGIRRLWTRISTCDGRGLSQGRRDSADLNFAKRLALHSGYLLETDQFEQRKKGHHHFGTAGNALEQFGKSKARTLAERPHQVLDLLADRPFVFKDVPPVFRPAEPLEHDVDGVDQVEDGGFRTRGLLRRKFQFAGRARENVFLPGFEDLELRRGILEFLVFDQLADQFPARVFALIFAFHLRLLVNGQQFAALDVHQSRGHHQKLARNLQVQHPQGVDVLDELGRQPGEIHLVNVHLLLLYQIKKQIERAFKDLEFYLIFSHLDQRRHLAPGPPILGAGGRLGNARTERLRFCRASSAE